ncbi:hypothetical protein [Leptolyngbya sp. FACHB-261]|uniref:hypothetical protein n=1 Tax=Leptolyngbya sp. FACHB-261 TaxID=2692806 RepID=UPI0016827AA7|nr:hypothetical protein [Leptolyngbya sp. FACHB-261]MBD2102223.1 hypothetical protein [Leptolyngbya sp. FACHB-261]
MYRMYQGQDQTEAELRLYLAGFADGKAGASANQLDPLYQAGYTNAVLDSVAQAQIRKTKRPQAVG